MGTYYIKATMENGESANSGPTIHYKHGIVVHPNPDRTTNDSCGVGIHLAKSLRNARRYVPDAREFYLAHPGVILGEDETKVRCASCEIIKLLSPTEIAEIERQEETEQERMKREQKMRSCLGQIYVNGGLPGKEWLSQHGNDITQEDIDNQTLEIFRDDKRVCGIKARLNGSKTRKVLKVVTA